MNINFQCLSKTGSMTCALLMWAVAGQAQIEVVLEPTRDNTVYQSETNTNSSGSGVSLFAGRNNEGDLRRALLAFENLPALVPGARVTSAELSLHVSNGRSPAANFQLHRLLADWGEGESAASGAGGQGAPAETGDATWLHRFFDTELWTTEGGDFDPLVSSSTSISGVASYVFPSTPELIADIAFWIANPDQNFGWILRSEEAEGVTTARRFDSREAEDVTLRPVLTLTVELSQSALSGLFFDTDSPGEGYLVFATASGTVIFFFGYNDDGSQLWLISETLNNPIRLGVATTLTMRSGTGGAFASPVPPESLEDYGTLEVLFEDGCLGGQFTLTGNDGTKAQDVVKLANVEGTDCP